MLLKANTILGTQRQHSYAIVDEVDSVLIDDARTPLIISGPIPQGGNHEFNELKPKISSLVQIQRQLVTKILSRYMYFNEPTRMLPFQSAYISAT